MFGKQTRERAIIGMVALLAGGSLLLVGQMETNTQDWQNWVTVDSKARQEFGHFQSLFGANDHVIASWPGCTIEDPRLTRFTHQLDRLDRGRLIDRVVTGREAVEKLVESTSLSIEQAKRRFRGVFFGPDLETTCAVIQLSFDGSDRRRQSIELIERAGKSVKGIDSAQLYLGGNAFVNTQLDRQTNRSMLLAIPAILLAVVVAWISIQSLPLTLAALSASGVAALFSLGLVLLFGYKINGLLILMPVLVLAITLSASIHLLSYFRAARDSGGTDPIASMIQSGWRPAAFALFTSAIGLVSLSISRVPAVSQFGLFSALAVLIGLGLLLLFFPPVLRLASRFSKPSTTRTEPFHWGSVRGVCFKLATRYSMLIIGLFIAGLVGASLGLPRVQSQLQNETLFGEQSRYRKAASWLENNVIPLENIEVLLTFEGARTDQIAEQLYRVARVQVALRDLPDIEVAFSVLNVLESLPQPGHDAQSLARRTLFNEAISERLPQLDRGNLVADSNDRRHWRITLGCLAERSLDYSEVVASCRQLIEDAAEKPPGAELAEFRVTGLSALAARGHQSLFTDLVRSFLMALALITPMMMLLLRQAVAGLLAMIPNLTPPVLLFGALGWLRYPVDVGMVLTASVGLGIAVDNTFHFLYYYRRQKHRGQNQHETSSLDALRRTFAHCSTPMAQTTGICCFGLACFVFAEFLPVRQFAVAIVAILLLALLADWLLLPALVSIRGGRLFLRNRDQDRRGLNNPPSVGPAGAGEPTTKRPARQPTR